MNLNSTKYSGTTWMFYFAAVNLLESFPVPTNIAHQTDPQRRGEGTLCSTLVWSGPVFMNDEPVCGAYEQQQCHPPQPVSSAGSQMAEHVISARATTALFQVTIIQFRERTKAKLTLKSWGSQIHFDPPSSTHFSSSHFASTEFGYRKGPWDPLCRTDNAVSSVTISSRIIIIIIIICH